MKTPKFTGIIVNGQSDLADIVINEVDPIMQIVKKLSDYGTALAALRESSPDVLFVDVSGTVDKAIPLIERARREAPELSVVMIGAERDPDLLLKGLRAGICDFFDLPRARAEIVPALEKHLRRKAASTVSTAEIAAVFSLKGGQGVTSLAVNLADTLHHLTDTRVLLLDLNLYLGDVSTYLDLGPLYTPFDFLNDIERMDEQLLLSSLTRHPKGFRVLAASDEINDADRVSGQDISRILEALKPYLNYIVVDLPHTLSERTLAITDKADHLILPVQQSIPVIKHVRKTQELFEQLNYDREKIKIVANRFQSSDDITREDMEAVFQQPLFATLSNDHATFLSAVVAGVPLDAAHGKKPIHRDYCALGIRLFGIPRAPPKRSWWQKLIHRSTETRPLP
ncbi:MAG: hypothetical protein JJV98_15970 [Desulfosarcina sp.]|nr:hypothetical protein [Desulfobacterales bacterium]